MKKLTEEIKPINGYEGLYEISNYGYVKSLRRNIILKTRLINDNKYYAATNLSKKGEIKQVYIHQLVWDHFGDRPRNGRLLQIDHVNGIKIDNKISNLQLLTAKKNMRKAYTQRNEIKKLLTHKKIKGFEIKRIEKIKNIEIKSLSIMWAMNSGMDIIRQNKIKEESMVIEFHDLLDYFKHFKDDENVSKEKIAGIFNISTTYLYLLIQKKRYPSYELGKRMSVFFNIPIENLMKPTKTKKRVL